MRPTSLNVLHVSIADDFAGGASRASYRIHRSLAELPAGQGIRSIMLVGRKHGSDSSVHPIETSRPGQIFANSMAKVAARELYLFRTENPMFHSTSRFPTAALRRIHQIDPDIVILHLLGDRSLSIRQVGRLLSGARPVAWVLHDSWAFCGAEHHPHWQGDSRFIEGYTRSNRLKAERGVDMNRRTWRRKYRHWKHPAYLIAPSRWMAKWANESALMASWPTTVIPNPIDTSWWGALSRSEARARLGIPQDRKIILFGANGGEQNEIKGADLLRQALPRVVEEMLAMRHPSPEFLTFGGPPSVAHVAGITVRSVGRLDDDGLRLHYSAADVMVVPSRQESFGQTASEAMACGTPVVAFSIGGLLDIIDDGVNGRLVDPFDIQKLAEAIVWALSDSERHSRLSQAARQLAFRMDQRRVGALYAGHLQQVVAINRFRAGEDSSL